MLVKFDAITPLPSPDEQQRSMVLRQGRKDRQSRAAELRRAQLLAVAWELLKELGLAGFNMRALGLRAGYTAGAMYGYFTSRDQILLALRDRWVEELTLTVSQIRSPRRIRRSAPVKAAGPLDGHQGHEDDAAADARERFLVRSEAWWRHLTLEPFAVPLLLLHGPQQEVGASTAALSEDDAQTLRPVQTPLLFLELATQACVQDLEAAGWTADQALRLQREALCLGVGLAVLGVSQSPGGQQARVAPNAHGFRLILERWLHQGQQSARSPVHLPGGGQSDLFAG